jgi:hypothetical protein
MGLCRVLWTGLLAEFNGSMKSLELCLNVVLHKLLDDGRTLSVSPKKEQIEAYDGRDRVGMGGQRRRRGHSLVATRWCWGAVPSEGKGSVMIPFGSQLALWPRLELSFVPGSSYGHDQLKPRVYIVMDMSLRRWNSLKRGWDAFAFMQIEYSCL